MGRQKVAFVGDTTTTGGRILTGEDCVRSEGMPAALIGDNVFCPKCGQNGVIIEGCTTFNVQGKPVAYNGSQVACGCPAGTHRIVATTSMVFVDPSANTYTLPTTAYKIQSPRTTRPTQPNTHINRTSNNPLTTHWHNGNSPHNAPQNDIRLDAKALIQCAEEICEKHLYYPEIKQAFMDDVTTFAQQIVTEVDSGSKSYEQGKSELKAEEKDILAQSTEYFLSGLSVLGGLGLIGAGISLCTTGFGCFIGSTLIAHGANSIEEGVRGIATGDSNQTGFLKDTYKASAKGLGFDESVGELAYNLVDLGLSVHGKLKLVPKINEYGNQVRKLFYFSRKDLEMAYKQMRDIALYSEIITDVVALYDIVEKANNLFILDKNTEQANIVIGEPEKITNVGEIVENCSIFIKITGKEENDDVYYLCTDNHGHQYKKPFYNE